ncbi:response regulator [Aliiruegeria sabulilitoris]|uniref:response regulator n=1 Tax=Aliiruegeria sabulilitoris TaxID=1510458 RepID=UPI0008341645|nr:response regulator [Aliiruegeria sabulilitoris]NDR59719.1 response regulator [Pseudoruegeria sp. M32A2M]
MPTLPAPSGDGPSTGDDSNPADYGCIAGARLLVFSGNAHATLPLVQILNHLGASVDLVFGERPVRDPQEAQDHDVLLIDTDCEDGLELLSDAAATPGGPPVMALCSNMTKEDEQRLRDLGADAVQPTPIMAIAPLASALARLLKRRDHEPPVVPSSAEGTAAAASGAGCALRSLIRIAGPDQAVSLLDEMHSDLQRSLRELRACVNACDLAGVLAQTHILIALTGAAGADRLQRLSEELNRAGHDADQDRIAALSPRLEAGLSELLSEIMRERRRLTGESGT